MEFITEILPGACTNAVKKLWKWFSMVRSVEHELKSLRERTNMLSEREQDVMMELERKEVEQGMKRKREVDIWLQNVKRVKSEVDSVEEKVREERGWIQRCRLGMHIADVETEVVQLQERSGFSDGVAMEPLLGSGSPQPAATLLEDYSIDTETLIENWVGEGMIDEKGNIGKERDKGITILNELKDACMLEDSHLIEYPNIPTVKLHDLIRDLAIKITRERPRFIAKAREQLEESPKVEEWIEDTKRVSLMRNRIQLLSGRPKCPELTTLLLQNNIMLWEISNSFFENIQGLRVLDLSNSKIKFLPESFCKLENLRVLRLNDCKYLKKLPSLVRLRQLRILCLNWTSIEEVPREMKELVNLRKLHLEHTTRLQLFPAEIISNLFLLEDLRMRESGWRWPSTNSRATAVIEEIVNLTRITVLRLCFKDVQSFIKLVGSNMLRKVKSFSLVIGDLILIQLPHPVDNVVLVGGGSDVGRNASSLILPFKTERLFIERCHDITQLSQFSCLANATQLTSCHIEQCNGMESIVMADEKTLINLAYLHLYNLHNLRALSCGVPSIETFTNLEMLYVEGCNQMKKLLSLELLQNLQNLGSIQIKNCCLMEDIVATDGNAVTTFSLQKLKYLRLEHLPELKSMFNTTVTCPSLKSIGVGECPKLKKLPFTSKNLSPTLKRLRGEKKWWDAMEWDDPNLKIQLQDCFIDRK
ncbi:hypothetical protein AAC387_Pa04g1735 [Persea americana]